MRCPASFDRCQSFTLKSLHYLPVDGETFGDRFTTHDVYFDEGHFPEVVVGPAWSYINGLNGTDLVFDDLVCDGGILLHAYAVGVSTILPCL